jgi:hypothetical protein
MKLNFVVQKYEKDRWYLFGLFCLLNILFLFLINDVIITDPQYFTGGNENTVELFRNFYNVVYVINPIYVFIKIAFIASILKLGAALYCNLQLEFKQLFTLATISGFVLLLPDLIEVFWFMVIHTSYTMEEVKYFSPFSLYSLFGHAEISDSNKYMLALINPFEIIYWFVLIVGLKDLGAKSRQNGLKIVAGSYGVLLLVIILFNWVLYYSVLPPN